MPFDISKYSKGLAGALGLKERGMGLPQLADQLVGTIDTRDLYLLDERVFVPFTSIAAPATGPTAFVDGTVPPGELWYCWYFHVGSQPGAGAAITVAPALFVDGSPIASTIADYLSILATENAQAVNRAPFWAGPGTRFAAYVKNVTLAPGISGGVQITRLRV